jgi:hypothetical protein
MLTIMSQIRFPLHCCYATASSNSSISSTTTTSQVVLNGNTLSSRQEIRLGLPSKGRMSSDTLDLLKDCQLSVKQVNPRQYVAQIPQVSSILTFSPTLVFNFITHIDVYYYQQLIRSLTIDIDINDEFADFQLGSLVPKT